MASSSEDDDADFSNIPFPQDTAMQQLQQITSNFIDQFGFNEDEFGEQEEKTDSPFTDKISSIDFSNVNEDLSRTDATKFEQYCNERLEQFDNDSDEDICEEKEITFSPNAQQKQRSERLPVASGSSNEIYNSTESEKELDSPERIVQQPTTPAEKMDIDSNEEIVKVTIYKRIMYCPDCGGKLKAHWRFCAHCGTNIDRGQEEDLSEAMGAVQINIREERASATQVAEKDDDPVSESAIGQEIVTETYPSNTESANVAEIDWENLEFGSDAWMDDDSLVSQEDMDEYQRILEESGFNALMKKLSDKNNAWQQVEINIAITGESGTGKSTLINALRNMKADDAGGAKIGCTETTKEPTPYPYVGHENVKIWDLPGVGTPNFSKETYLKKIKIESYDFVLLVSSSRYKENDTWLATQISKHYPNSNLFFVRTKVDNDLRDYQQGHRLSLFAGQRTQLCKKIRHDSLENLIAAGIIDAKMFLVNSHKTNVLDFGKLQGMLIEKVSALKRDAMILSLSSVSNDVVAEKIRVLESRLAEISLTGAIAAIGPERENGKRMELDVLMGEVIFYKKQLGIDANSLGIIAKTLKKDVEEIYIKLNMNSHAILRTTASFAQFYDQYDTFRPTAFHSLPYFGKRSKVRNYQRQCRMVLKKLLTLCSSETNRLHTNLAIWLNE